MGFPLKSGLGDNLAQKLYDAFESFKTTIQTALNNKISTDKVVTLENLETTTDDSFVASATAVKELNSNLDELETQIDNINDSLGSLLMIKTVYGDKQDVSAGNFLFEISVPAVEGYKPVGVVGYNINQRAYDMNITCVLLYTSSIARIAGKAYENSKSITPEVRVLYIGA